MLFNIIEFQRNAAIDVIDNALRGPLKAVRWTSPGKKLTVGIFCRLAVWSGQSYARTVLYKSGELGEAIVRNPFNRELMAAIIVGAFESLERKPFGHTWKNVEGDDVISIWPEPSRPDIAERLVHAHLPTKKGNRSYPRCPWCGAPSVLNLKWYPDEGKIMDTRHGVRMAFLDCHTTRVVFRELAKELGDDIYPIIIDAQWAFSLRYLREEFLGGGDVGGTVDRDTFYTQVLDTMTLRGLGNMLSHEIEGDTLNVVVENPFEEHCLAGMFSAMYMLGEGKPAKVSWRELDPSTLEFNLTDVG